MTSKLGEAKALGCHQALHWGSQCTCTGPPWWSAVSGRSWVPTAWWAAFLQGVESVKKELDQSVLGQTGPYRRPERLRKRKEFAGEKFKEEKVFEPNE